ncbi:U2 snRNP component IST3 [Uncinocarpus reesii 1704]|uniref:U2 snRNP component IST3 n=1 Tax=Uncinocarpus reesii (strain UAMH 1704) TaxID=336963 RepID=C4JLH7_UNCRE|nr:U2 snRNP component IST3 [Uncinocarpus reesii 1704]EEP78839.1 U2 snRNP component IST3 [Uncinocarpus reesii 1704]
MNSIRQIQALNKRELENAVSPEASWHADYRDTAYIYIGGLPYDLSEGDILTIFSQFGEPVHLNLVRDKETGKSKGFAFLKYEDQRSTDLAVDNLCGANIMGRLLRVDHMRYKRKEEEGLEDNIALLEKEEQEKERDRPSRDRDSHRGSRKRRSESRSDNERRRRPLLKEEQELARLIEEHDDEDPMKQYLIQEKREEVAKALEKSKSSRRRRNSTERRDRSRHRHRHHHRRRRSEERSRSRDRCEKSGTQSPPRERRHRKRDD